MTNPSDPWAQRPDSPDTPTERIGAPGEPEGSHTTEYSDTYGAGRNPAEPYQYFDQPPGPNPTRQLPPYQSQWGVYDAPEGYESQWGGPAEMHYPHGGPAGAPTGQAPTVQYGPGYNPTAEYGPGYNPAGGYGPPGLPVEPQRPGRRGTWVALSFGIFAVVVLGAAALGFFLSGHDSSSSSSSVAGGTTGSAPMQFPVFPQNPGGPVIPSMPQLPGTDNLGATMGTVATNDGSTLTIDSLSGSTVTVHTDAKTQVISLGAGTLADLHTGDMVVVQGGKNPDGSILAKIIIGTTIPTTPTPMPTPTR